MRRIEKLRLDVNKEDSFNIVNFKQYDNCDLILTLYKDNSVLDVTGQTVIFYVKKPDDKYVEQINDIVVDKNTITIKIDEQVVTTKGRAYAELSLRDLQGKMTTASFVIHIGEQKVNIDNLIESDDKVAVLDEIRDFIDKAKIDIEQFKKDNAQLINDINQVSFKIEDFNSTIDIKKGQAITDIEDKKALVIGELNTSKTSLVEEITSTKDNALTEITANKESINGLLEDVKVETNKCIEEVKTTTQSNIEAFNQLKIDIEALNNIAISTKTELETVKNNSSSLKTELENVKQASSTVLTELTNKISEANLSKGDLDKLLENILLNINNANETISTLQLENTKAGTNINTLNPLNTEADLNIDELKALITEAKEIAIPALKAYIAEHTPAEDLTEVNKQLEELYNAVQELDIRFNSYYTKAEVDEKISNIDLSLYAKKDEVDASLLNKVDKEDGKGLSKNDFTDSLKSKLEGLDTIKGVIGAGEKIATPPIGMFDNIPEPPEKSGAEYIGKIMYKAGDYYYVLYMYNTEKYNPYLYVDTSTTNAILIRENQFGTSYNTLVGYRRTTISESWTATAYAFIYPEFKTYGIYHLDLPIYSDKNKTGIYRHPTTNETISNLDLITEPGDYLLNATVSNYNNIQNMPPVKLKNDLETILKCYKKDNNVYQELVIEGITYNRKVGDLWIYNKHNDCVKKEIIAEIKNKEITVFSVLPDIYSTCPKPNLSCDITGEIAFKRNDGLYAMWYVTTKINNPMFYNYSDKYLGYTGAYQNLIKYNYQNGAWTEDTGTSINTTITTGEFEIYKNTLPVCKGTSSTAYDKNTILKEATTDEEEKTLNSFNLATDVGTYKVEITEAGGIEYSPVVGAISGILKVEKADKYIKQILTTTDNKQYIRVFNTIWSEWTTVGGDIDLSSYATKEELINKVDKEEGKGLTSNDFTDSLKLKLEGLENTDLSNFYNKEEIDNLLNSASSNGDNYIGLVGESNLPSCYLNIPKPNYEVKQELWIKDYTKNKEMLIYVYQPADGGIQIYTGSAMSFVKIDTVGGTASTVYEGYAWNGSAWEKTTDATTIYIEPGSPDDVVINKAKEIIYYCNTDIYEYNTKTVKIPAIPKPALEVYSDFNSCIKAGVYEVMQKDKVIGNTPTTKPLEGLLKVDTVKKYIQQQLSTVEGDRYIRLHDGDVWSSWTCLNREDIEATQTTPAGLEVLTPSMFALNHENIRVEYGEYIVDTSKNSPHVADSEREYTDVIYLKQGGFKKILGCTVSPNRVDFHYSMWTNINMLLVDETVIPDCMRLYMSYNPPEKLWKGGPWNPTTGIQKIKYCVIGY